MTTNNYKKPTCVNSSVNLSQYQEDHRSGTWLNWSSSTGCSSYRGYVLVTRSCPWDSIQLDPRSSRGWPRSLPRGGSFQFHLHPLISFSDFGIQDVEFFRDDFVHPERESPEIFQRISVIFEPLGHKLCFRPL